MKASQEPRSVEFRQQREADWTELSDLSERVLRRGLTALGEEELERLPRLYRAAVASLAVARRTALDRALVHYLDALAARAYLAIYGTRKTRRGALFAAFAYGFPERVRSMKWELLASFGVTALGTMVAFALVARDPGWYYAFVDPALAAGRDPSASTAELRRVLYDAQGAGGLSLFASFLFVHNARIGLLAYAVGFAAGVPTAFLLFQNGLMLGAFAGLYASRGLLVPLCGWLLPHGIPEIGAVILCGAAGLHLGRAMVLPGALTARRSLAEAGRRTALVAMGSVLLFAVAGVVEGVFRQVVTNDGARFSLAAFNALWLGVWLIFAGRQRAPEVVR
jgi:uncharacterized membrane protein SpoIIM required for sporulation